MPTVVAAEGDLVPARGGAGDTNGDCAGLSTGARVTNHVRPRMQCDEFLGEIDLFGRVERGEIPFVYNCANRIVHDRVGVTQDVRADPHEAQVEESSTIKVPDRAPLSAIEIGRPARGH